VNKAGDWLVLDGYTVAPQLVQRRSFISRQQISPIGKQKIARQMPQHVNCSVSIPACTEYLALNMGASCISYN